MMGNQPPLFEKASEAPDKGEADRRSHGNCQGGQDPASTVFLLPPLLLTPRTFR